jgi:hypothetical protein
VTGPEDRVRPPDVEIRARATARELRFVTPPRGHTRATAGESESERRGLPFGVHAPGDTHRGVGVRSRLVGWLRVFRP